MAERRPPGYKDIQKHWLPRNIGPVFYSIAFSVFFGIFGYLVSRFAFVLLERRGVLIIISIESVLL
jgi:hypothetical protein